LSQTVTRRLSLIKAGQLKCLTENFMVQIGV